MSQTVADILVSVLEQIGVKHIFGLIGDSLNPLADAVRRSKIEWIGVRHEEGAALAAAGQAKLTGQLAVCAGTTGPVVRIWWPVCMRRAVTMRPSALSGDMPRKSCTAPTIYRRPSRISFFATFRSIRKRFPPRRRRRKSFIRRSPLPTQVVASLTLRCRKMLSRRRQTAASPASQP